jgi:ABC-type sugar transport system substrate-binding protein
VGSLDQRAKGFKEGIATKYPNLKLVADKVADGMPTTGLNIMTDLITANPDLRGVFASNLTKAQGAGQAIAENKVSDKIMLIGFDSDDKTVKLLADGNIKALIVQDPSLKRNASARARHGRDLPPLLIRTITPQGERRETRTDGRAGMTRAPSSLN